MMKGKILPPAQIGKLRHLVFELSYPRRQTVVARWRRGARWIGLCRHVMWVGYLIRHDMEEAYAAQDARLAAEMTGKCIGRRELSP